MTKPLDTLTLATRATMQQKNRLSVKSIGVGLTGLGAVNQRIPVELPTHQLLIGSVQSLETIKIETTGESLRGQKVDTGKSKDWTDKLDHLGQYIEETKPCYFVVFRKSNNCLIITYVPDMAKPQKKMLYASNKESVKDALMALDPEMNLEEYNIAEVADLSYAQYQKKTDVPKPYSEAEIRRQEHDNAETAGGYGIIARINAAGPGHSISKGRPMSLKTGDANAKPMALPGLSGGFDPKSLRASLKPIGKTKIPSSAQGSFMERRQGSFSTVKDEHYDNIMKQFGVNDREKRARLELDTILADAGNEDDDENLPFALRKKKEVDVDESILSPSAPVNTTPQAAATTGGAKVVTETETPAPAQATATEKPKKPKKPNLFVRIFGFLFKKKVPKPSSNIEDLV